MSHKAGHHIEHAEHAAHAADDSFNAKVTITIAIIAAALAAVTIQGHRAHNMMLSKQIESANARTEASNKWAQFQAYNIRSHAYQMQSELAAFTAREPGTDDARGRTIDRWSTKFKQYEDEKLPKTQKEAESLTEQSKELMEQAEFWHHKAERLDLGDLGLQLGVVFASLAILTKRRGLWYLGMAAAAIGLVVAISGFLGILITGHAGH